MKPLADQFLRDVGAVAIGRVDEIDADLGKPAQGGKRRRTVGRRSPDAGPGEPHGAKTETVDRDVSDTELTGGAGVDHAHSSHLSAPCVRKPPLTHCVTIDSNSGARSSHTQ